MPNPSQILRTLGAAARPAAATGKAPGLVPTALNAVHSPLRLPHLATNASYSMTACSTHRPLQLRSAGPVGTPAPPSSRSLFTVAPAKTSGFEDIQAEGAYFRDFIKALQNAHPELAGARFRGLHASTASRVRGIVANGFDLNLVGRNFKGYSQDGSGIYITDNPYRAVYYARKALESDLSDKPAARDEIPPLQMIAVFEQAVGNGSGKPPRRAPEEDETVTYLPEGGKEVRIPPEAIASEKLSYMAVALPEFDANKAEQMKMWLCEALYDYVS